MTEDAGWLLARDCELLNAYLAHRCSARDLTQLSNGLAAELGSRLYDLDLEGFDPADAWGQLLAGLPPALAEAVVRRLDDAAADGLAGPVVARPAPRPRPSSVADLEAVLSATRWHWPLWLPIGFLTLLAGEAGVGKTFVALWLAACLLRGRPWPDETDGPDGQGSIVWVDTEASQALLAERVACWALPAERILLPTLTPGDPVADVQLDTEEGWLALQTLVAAERPRLVVVDSLRGAHRGDENSSEMVTLMTRLAALARDRRCAVLAAHHLRKRNEFEDGSEVTLDRLRGSSAIGALGRVVLAVDTPDATQKDVRRLAVIKSNLGKYPEPLGFRVAEDGLAFCDAPAKPTPETRTGRAAEFLRAALTDGPVLIDDLIKDAKEAGIAERTLRRAKDGLLIVARKEDGVRHGRWLWGLPAHREAP